MVCRIRNLRPDEVGQLVCELKEEGCVVSIYDKAVNILLYKGVLVSLVVGPEQMTPMSVRCPDLFKHINSGQVKLLVGDLSRIDPDRMVIAGLKIDLERVNRFQGIADPDRMGGLDPTKISTFGKTLCLLGRKGGLLGLIDATLADNPFVTQGLLLRDGLLSSQPSRRVDSLTKFVGLGTGFTPSGDDLICGFLLGEKMVAFSHGSDGRPVREPQPSILTEEEKIGIWEAAANTNEGGRTLIWMALKGGFPAFLLDTVKGVAKAKGPADMFRVVNAAVNHGHTSGTDALVGLLLYFRMSQKYAGVAYGSVVTVASNGIGPQSNLRHCG